MDTPHDPYADHHAGLLHVHRELLALFDTLRATWEHMPLKPTVELALGAGNALLGHHHRESEGLFPGLRRYGRLRSADVAFLDARDTEHRALHGLCVRLLDSARAPHPKVSELVLLGGQLADAMRPHFADEEAGLAPERLRLMIAPDALVELGRTLGGPPPP
ncbi:hemerythrin domain-containing protein [Pyxidicoccus xibeiensis]|uniref:hemerythrin domain-containing protein n=1 Tax=Pyxidicoccus xibeiensis TaxID=2906759 RepID=UPI0020A7EBD3|nr:hemerythrin domain-containing protein [Pyxidicoccus xibeiensis]MCP3141375.1 hemerythrin domain-containing protein [Pyxidicoccus xibeiensis]